MTELAKKEEAQPEHIEREPRCPEMKNGAQCTRNEGHKGEHMANAQDFIVTWET